MIGRAVTAISLPLAILALAGAPAAFGGGGSDAADDRAGAAAKRTYARFAGPSQFMPAELFIGAHTTITQMSWQSWQPRSAQGTGLLQFNDCIPSCADGKVTPTPATVAMNGRTKCGKRHIYKVLRFSFVRPVDGQPDTIKVSFYCPKN